MNDTNLVANTRFSVWKAGMWSWTVCDSIWWNEEEHETEHRNEN